MQISVYQNRDNISYLEKQAEVDKKKIENVSKKLNILDVNKQNNSMFQESQILNGSKFEIRQDFEDFRNKVRNSVNVLVNQSEKIIKQQAENKNKITDLSRNNIEDSLENKNSQVGFGKQNQSKFQFQVAVNDLQIPQDIDKISQMPEEIDIHDNQNFEKDFLETKSIAFQNHTQYLIDTHQHIGRYSRKIFQGNDNEYLKNALFENFLNSNLNLNEEYVLQLQGLLNVGNFKISDEVLLKIMSQENVSKWLGKIQNESNDESNKNSVLYSDDDSEDPIENNNNEVVIKQSQNVQNPVDDLLKEIQSIAEEKETTNDPHKVPGYNKEIQAKLCQLLEIIIENEDVIQVLNIDNRNINLKTNEILKYLVKNVEKFNGYIFFQHGRRSAHGHLKSKLLFIYLKEFKLLNTNQFQVSAKEKKSQMTPTKESFIYKAKTHTAFQKTQVAKNQNSFQMPQVNQKYLIEKGPVSKFRQNDQKQTIKKNSNPNQWIGRPDLGDSDFESDDDFSRA